MNMNLVFNMVHEYGITVWHTQIYFCHVFDVRGDNLDTFYIFIFNF